MALNPRIVVSDVDVSWDNGTTHVPRGTLVDAAPGSALETAYGAGNLRAYVAGQDDYAAKAN